MHPATATDARGQRVPGFYGWKLVGVLWFLDFLNMGFPLFGGAVINTYMLREIPMSRSTFGLGFSLLNLFVGLPAIIVGAAIVRWGIRRSFAIGSATTLAGALWLALFASRPWHYLLGFGVIIGSGISFATLVPVTTSVTRWFRRYRGRAMALALSASGFAGFIGAPFANKVLAANGGNWRQAWEIVVGIAVFSALFAYTFVKESPESVGQLVDGGDAPRSSTEDRVTDALATKFSWTPGDALATRAYWLLVIGGIACQYPYFFFIAHGLLHMTGAGIARADAAWAMGLFTMGAVLGRLIGGWLMDRVAGRLAFISGLCCYFLGSFLAVRLDAHYLSIAYAAAILYGTAFGWSFVSLNTAIAHFFGPTAFPKLNGTALLVTAIFCSPAGVIGGKLFDLNGNYTAAIELNALIALLGIVALSFATMPGEPQTATVARSAEAPAGN